MKKSLWFILFLILALGVGFWFSFWKEKWKDEKNYQENVTTQKALETLIPSLEKFRKVKGAYPSSLKTLVPAYLAALPRTPKDFFYEQDKKEYHLYFISLDSGIGKNVCYYSPKDNTWLEMDGFDWPREILERAESYRVK